MGLFALSASAANTLSTLNYLYIVDCSGNEVTRYTYTAGGPSPDYSPLSQNLYSL